MVLIFFLCFFLLSFETRLSVTEKVNLSFDDSEETATTAEWENKKEPIRLIGSMIDEARAVVMTIMRGELSEDLKKEMEKRNIDLSGSYDGMSRVIRKCLKKAKNIEGKETFKNCVDQAVKERQNEEVQEGDEDNGPTKNCIQEAMYEASQTAAPLMMEAQEYSAMLRETVQETAADMAKCRGEDRPLRCVVEAWNGAQQNLTYLREQIFEVIMVARDIYIQYTDEVRKCMMPVEEAGEEENENENGNEEGGEEETKKDPSQSTPEYYDAVEEIRRKKLSRLPYPYSLYSF